MTTKKRIFQNLVDSMSSGTQNAQNFALVISRVVLGPSFLTMFYMFSKFHLKLTPKNGFSKNCPILCHAVCKIIRSSPRSFDPLQQETSEHLGFVFWHCFCKSVFCSQWETIGQLALWGGPIGFMAGPWGPTWAPRGPHGRPMGSLGAPWPPLAPMKPIRKIQLDTRMRKSTNHPSLRMVGQGAFPNWKCAALGHSI